MSIILQTNPTEKRARLQQLLEWGYISHGQAEVMLADYCRLFESQNCDERKVIEMAKQKIKEIKETKTTKFYVTMALEIVNVGGIPGDASSISDAIRTEIEGISSGDVVKVTDIAVGTSFPRN